MNNFVLETLNGDNARLFQRLFENGKDEEPPKIGELRIPGEQPNLSDLLERLGTTLQGSISYTDLHTTKDTSPC